MSATIQNRGNLVAALGSLLIAPALILFLSGMLQSIGGIDLMLLPTFFLHPAVILGGIVLAIVLNAWAVLSFSFTREESHYRFFVDVRLLTANLVVLGTAAFLMCAILSYVVVENLATSFL